MLPLVLSSDSHVFEPPDLWQTRIDRAFRDRAPRIERIDGGDSWTQVDLGAPVPHTMFKVAFDEHQPDRMSCATNGGEVWSSHDGGESWAPQPPPPGGTQIYALARG